MLKSKLLPLMLFCGVIGSLMSQDNQMRVPIEASVAGNTHNISIVNENNIITFKYISGGYLSTAGTNLVNKFGMILLNFPCEQFADTTFPPVIPAPWTLTYSGTLYWTRQTPSGYGVGVGSASYDMWNSVAGTTQSLQTYVFTPTTSGFLGLIIDWAYRPYPATLPYNQDSLIINASTNGGSTYSLIFRPGPLQLQTVIAANTEFTTPAPNNWIKRMLPLPIGTNMLQFIGKSGFGNHLFLDSICVGYLPEGINNIEGILPGAYFLLQNYPNPFNPSTKITYGLPKPGNVKIIIYDILGREVKILVNEFKQASFYEVSFDGSYLASGIYFYSIKANDFTETKKMLIIK